MEIKFKAINAQSISIDSKYYDKIMACIKIIIVFKAEEHEMATAYNIDTITLSNEKFEKEFDPAIVKGFYCKKTDNNHYYVETEPKEFIRFAGVEFHG